MLVPLAGMPTPGRTWLMIGLLALAVAAGGVLGQVAKPEAQPLVLYDATPSRAFVLPQLVAVAESTAKTWEGLQAIRATGRTGREILLVLVDNLFALGYGAGFGLLYLALSNLASRNGRLSNLVADLLRFAAACYPVAAAFDLIENQLVAILLLLPPGGVGEILILAARYCAIPKYDLSLLVGPTTALLAGVVAAVSYLRRPAAAE